MTKSVSAPIPAYEQRTVAFIDILGFSQHVRRTADEPAFVARLYDALRLVDRQGRLWVAQAIGGPDTPAAEVAAQTAAMDFRMQVFSDSLVLSQRGNVGGLLFVRVSQLAMALLELDVLIRGGIAQGSLYHDDTVVFGPALVEAYTLESKRAKFPRVIVSQQGLDTARQHFMALQAPESAQSVAELLRRDADRMCYLDYIRTAWL